MRPAADRKNSRRGVTLVEMLVTVALLMLVMLIIVQIFQSATGAIQTSRKFAALDEVNRRVDTLFRQDLKGITARLDASRPANPNENLGYFEYIENEFQDDQGEDSDDIIGMTVKAPEGSPFTGAVMLPYTLADGIHYRRVMITSNFAEVTYFLRNYNLYRRVLLVVPDRKNSLTVGTDKAGNVNPFGQYYSENVTIPGPLFNSQTVGGLPNSWQGAKDVSARPPIYLPPPLGTVANPNPVFPTQPVIPVPNTLGDLTDRQNRFARPRFDPDQNQDGYPDDSNGDGVADYYPTLYPNCSNVFDGYPSTPTRINSYDVQPFPFLYVGMYTKAAPPLGFPASASVNFPPVGVYGSIHTTAVANANGLGNHSPLEEGDSRGMAVPDPANPSQLQTFFGMPTWRETMGAGYWADPFYKVNAASQSTGLSMDAANFLWPSPMQSQPFNDYGQRSARTAAEPSPLIWQDDLIATNVRSFDVKAYDPDASLTVNQATGAVNAPGYYDLGYGSDPRLQGYDNRLEATTPVAYFPGGDLTRPLRGLGHEGRMPPLPNDNRLDANFPVRNVSGSFLVNNIGDNPNAPVLRMRRTYDTWSTTYTAAPSEGIDPFYGPNNPNPASANNRPIMPSFPAPYPVALRGLQIQIRTEDPQRTRTKVLTIRHDFSDKH